LLIESFIELSKGEESLRLIVAGSNSDKYSHNRYKNISFLGYVEKENFYGKIDVLVVPSLWDEPFGRVIIEAALRGIPVIVSKNGASLELLKLGVIGLEFDGSKRDLKKVMSELSSEFQEWKAAARERINDLEDVFSVEKVQINIYHL